MSKKSKQVQKAEAKKAIAKPSKDPMAQIAEQFQALEKRFDDFMSRGFLAPFDSDWPDTSLLAGDISTPRVDIIDKGKKLVVRAEVPGFDKDSIDVSVTDNSITLKGEIKDENKQEEGDFYQSEVRQMSFSRSLMLPSEVDSSKAKAKFKNGMLEIKLPKRKAEKKKKVDIE